MPARREWRLATFVALAAAAFCLLAGYYLFSHAVLLENACFLERDRACMEAVRRQVWIAFGLGGAFVVITGFLAARRVRRAWRNRQR